MPDAHGDDTERLDVRTLWGHEALDFTPWLAAHLGLIGETIGLRLELVEREHAVGQLSLDILARDTDADVRVAIENQLEAADLSHLGQLIAYATGSDAPTAVWVATGFRRELADALHQLNEWTRDGIRFYAVQVEVARTASHVDPEPRFRKVVYPGGRDESLVLSGPQLSPEAQRHHDFFAPLVADLVHSGFADRAVQHFDHTGRFVPSPLGSGIGYATSFEERAVWVTLHIRMHDNALTKRVFDELYADRASIEAELTALPAARWEWRRHDAHRFSSISIRRVGAIHDPPDRLTETRAWMLDMLPRLRAVFDPRLAVVVGRLRADDGA